MALRTRVAAAVALAATLALTLPPAAAAPAGAECPPGIGVGLASTAAGDARARTYVVAQAEPGDVVARAVRVCNGTDGTVRLQLYSNAAEVRDGQFLPVGEPRGTNALSSWTTVTPGSLTLQAGAAALVQVRVRVPQDAPRGEQYAVVYAELPPSGDGPVGVATRVGVRQYVSVFTGDRPRAELVVESLTAGRDAEGDPYVTASVRNTGDVALDPRGRLQLSDGPGGTAAGPFPVSVGTTLAPGQVQPVRVELARDLPAGPWTARLEVSSGSLRKAAEAVVRFPDGRDAASAPVAARDVPLAEDPAVVVPVAVGLLALVLLGLLLVLLARRRARGRRVLQRPPPAAARPTVPV